MTLTKIDDRGLKTPIDLLDNEYLRLGTGNDLELFHNGNHSFIQDVGTGNLYINSMNGNIHLRTSSNEQAVTCVQNAEVVLYHNNSRKLETASYGALVTGTMSAGSGNFDVSDNGKFKAGNSSDLQIYHSGTDSIIDNTQGELQITTDAVMRFNATEYKFNNAANNEKIANFFQDGACELYFNHSKKFETTSTGITVSGNISIGDGDELRLGDGNDLIIKHDSANTYISNQTGELVLNGDTIRLRKGDGLEDHLKCFANGSVELYHDGTKKLETLSTGIKASGHVFVDDSDKFIAGTGSDLLIYHGGTNSQIDNNTGDLNIRSDVLRFRDMNNEQYLAASSNAGVELYYNNSKKFETTSTGIKSQSSSDVVFRLTKTAASDAEIKNTNSLDLCCSSGGSGGQIIRFLTGANPSSLVEHMRINGSGHVLFNQSTTNTPGLNNTTVGACMEDIGTAGCALFVSRADSMSLFLNRNNTGQIVSFRQGGNEVGSISTNGTSLPSDRNFKKNMTDLTLGLDFVNTLKPSKYNLKLEEDTDPLLFGLIAQDVEESLTAAGVTKNSTVLCQHNPTESETESDYNLDYGKFIPILINAIKELSTKVAALEAA